MNEFLKFFEKLETIPAVLLLMLAAATGTVLFAPASLLEKLFLDQFRAAYGIYVGVTFLLLVALLASRIVLATARLFSQFQSSRKIRSDRTMALEQLTPEEKGYLAAYIIEQKNTVYVGLEDGVKGGLVSKKICHLSSRMVDFLDGAAFNLQPWAREHLSANPHLLEGAVGEPLTPQQKLHRR